VPQRAVSICRGHFSPIATEMNHGEHGEHGERHGKSTRSPGVEGSVVTPGVSIIVDSEFIWLFPVSPVFPVVLTLVEMGEKYRS
jgi:hypothetical protein